MKPNLTTTDNNRRRTFPKTDYSYIAANVADFRGTCVKNVTCARSFRKISDDYFKHEAPHSFASEAALFAVIAMTAALPIFNGASALAHFLRAVAF